MSNGNALPGGASTLSKYRALQPAAFPFTLHRAKGAVVWDAEETSYTDWISALLANLLGYCHPAVQRAVRAHLLTGGPSWSLPHPLELEVAETLVRLCGYPAGEGAVRFFKTGSEACSAAVRIARAVTSRYQVYSSGYHGWHDWTVPAPAYGVPPIPFGGTRLRTRRFPFGDWDATENGFFGLAPGDTDQERGKEDPTINGDYFAAVILEPVTTVEAPPGYLHQLRELCTRFRCLLIFDETITGCRYPSFTAGQHYSVQPDLTILGKGIANGYPLAAVVGHQSVMQCLGHDWTPDGPVFVSGTFSGETCALAAAKATLATWERKKVADTLWQRGHLLQELLKQVDVPDGVAITGLPYRIVLEAPEPERTFIRQRLCQKSELIGSGWNISAAHMPLDVQVAVQNFEETIDDLVHARTEGPLRKALVGNYVAATPYRQA